MKLGSLIAAAGRRLRPGKKDPGAASARTWNAGLSKSPTFFDFLAGRPRYSKADARRLNRRYQFIVEPFREELKDARVLDLAAHDGRWAYALAATGAQSVLGIEARQSLIDEFGRYPAGAVKSKVRLEQGDIFEALERLGRDGATFDVVTIYGIFYHIMEHYRLLRLVHRLKPRLIIVDSDFMVGASCYIAIMFEDPGRDINSTVQEGETRVPVGYASRMALDKMAECLGYRVEWVDWDALPPNDRDGVGDYFRPGDRRRGSCALRPVMEPAAPAKASSTIVASASAQEAR